MPDIDKEIAEGNFRTHNSLRTSIQASSGRENLYPVFRRFVVCDVFSSHTLIDEALESTLLQKHGQISNIELTRGRLLPRNTIIAKEVFNQSKNNEVDAQRTLFLFPFFSSHLSMPCKPGEHVWVMFEDIITPSRLGYWVSRIVGFDHVDDVNHSHMPREFDNEFNVLSAEGAAPRYHFKNGTFMRKDSDPSRENSFVLSSPFVKALPDQNLEAVYEEILQNSIASARVSREPVPRFNKLPGDLALEGSNNTLIVLGKERPNFSGSVSSTDLQPEYSTKAGTIDMVVGRGSTAGTAGNFVINDLGFSELDKFGNNLVPSEGDPDYSEDRSRILISQRTSPDKKFGIATYNTGSLKVNDSATGDAAIVIRSDKVRIIARSDIQFLVQGYTAGTDPAGGDVKVSTADTKNWSSITIKSDGNIIFTPSELGYIKLGGDDANRGILCTAVPVTAVNGGIEGQMVGNTGGGQMGGARSASPSGNLPMKDPSVGTFSNKVLIK